MAAEGISKEKVQKFEYFLNDVLRADLKISLERRDALFGQVAEYMELQKILDNIILSSDGVSPRPSIRTKVDLGCNFYVQGEVSDLSKVIVDVGAGVMLPMSPIEAKKFCDEKIGFLNKKIERLTNEELMLKSQINMVYSALQELQSL